MWIRACQDDNEQLPLNQRVRVGTADTAPLEFSAARGGSSVG